MSWFSFPYFNPHYLILLSCSRDFNIPAPSVPENYHFHSQQIRKLCPVVFDLHRDLLSLTSQIRLFPRRVWWYPRLFPSRFTNQTCFRSSFKLCWVPRPSLQHFWIYTLLFSNSHDYKLLPLSRQPRHPFDSKLPVIQLRYYQKSAFRPTNVLSRRALIAQ